MMVRIAFCGFVGLIAAGMGATAAGQAPAAGGSSASPAPTPLSAMANPAMNPYLNPYLNPAIASQRPMTGQDAALLLYMANSNRGGLGSGRISGTRPAPTGPTGAAVAGSAAGGPGTKPPTAAGGIRNRLGLGANRTRAKLPPGEMPNSVSLPGAGAARFFNPGGGAARGAGDYFGRQDYFNNNRR